MAKQRVTANPSSATLEQKEIQIPPQSITANPSSATLEQDEIQIPPQSITANPSSATLEQNVIQIPPQSITVTPSIASLEQNEIQIPSQSITVTPSSATLTQQKKPLLSLDINKRLKLIEKIIETIKKINNVYKIYTRYIYVKYIQNYSDNIKEKEEEEKIIKEIIEKNKINEYKDICDAINMLMVYLTTTARDIQEKYIDQEKCEEYKSYYETLVFNNKIIEEIEKNKDKDNYKYTIEYMKQLNTTLPKVFDGVENKKELDELLFSKQKGGNNNYKTLIDNIFNYTEDSDEYDILYDSDISEESTISIRSDYSEDLITPLLTSQA